MENWMDSKRWGELQLISNSSHTTQHTVGAHPTLAQLPARRKRKVGTGQEHLLAHRQLQRLVVGIKITFLVSLGTGHTLSGQGQPLADHPSHRRGCRGLWAHAPSQIKWLAELLPKCQHVCS